MFKYLKDLKNNLIFSIKNFKTDTFNSLGHLTPIIIVFISFMTGIIALIKFILENGYHQQIELLKTSGIVGVIGKFSDGTTNVLSQGFMLYLIVVLLFINFCIIIFNYIKKEKKLKQFISMFSLVCSIFSIITILIVSGNIFRLIRISEENQEVVLNIYNNISNETLSGIYLVSGIILGVSLLLNMILIFKSKYQFMLKEFAFAALTSLIIVPTFLWIFENIISVLVTLIFVIIIIFVLLKFVFKIEKKDNSASSKKDYMHKYGDATNKNNDSATHKSNVVEKEKIKPEPPKSENCAYITDYNKSAGIKLYKVHGVMHDYIATDNGLVDRELCSLSDYEKGKFHIYEEKTKREIKSEEIPWRK